MDLKSIYIKQVKQKGLREKDIKQYNLEHLVHKISDSKYILDKKKRNFKVVLTGGVFDALHIGHIKMLKEAKSYGDLLVVVLARSEFIKAKGRKPIHTLKERVELVQSLRFVDIAIPGSKDRLDVLSYVQPDIVAFGYDQKIFLNKKDVEIVRLHKYKTFNTSNNFVKYVY